jgi:hypothetical protein
MCESLEECLAHVEMLITGEEPESEEMPEGDMAAMWDEEANKRPTNPNMMG